MNLTKIISVFNFFNSSKIKSKEEPKLDEGTSLVKNTVYGYIDGMKEGDNFDVDALFERFDINAVSLESLDSFFNNTFEMNNFIEKLPFQSSNYFSLLSLYNSEKRNKLYDPRWGISNFSVGGSGCSDSLFILNPDKTINKLEEKLNDLEISTSMQKVFDKKYVDKVFENFRDFGTYELNNGGILSTVLNVDSVLFDVYLESQYRLNDINKNDAASRFAHGLIKSRNSFMSGIVILSNRGFREESKIVASEYLNTKFDVELKEAFNKSRDNSDLDYLKDIQDKMFYISNSFSEEQFQTVNNKVWEKKKKLFKSGSLDELNDVEKLFWESKEKGDVTLLTKLGSDYLSKALTASLTYNDRYLGYANQTWNVIYELYQYDSKAVNNFFKNHFKSKVRVRPFYSSSDSEKWDYYKKVKSKAERLGAKVPLVTNLSYFK